MHIDISQPGVVASVPSQTSGASQRIPKLTTFFETPKDVNSVGLFSGEGTRLFSLPHQHLVQLNTTTCLLAFYLCQSTHKDSELLIYMDCKLGQKNFQTDRH